MRSHILNTLGCLMLAMVSQATLRADELESARAAYEERTLALDVELQSSMEELHTNYLGALERLRNEEIQNGDLEQILLIEEEKTWVTAGDTPKVLSPNTGPGLKNLRGTYAKARLSLKKDRTGKQRELASKYIGYVETLQRQRVIKNDIEGALRCRDEIQRVKHQQHSAPPPAATTVQDPFASSAFDLPEDPSDPTDDFNQANEPIPEEPAQPERDPVVLRWSPGFDLDKVSASSGENQISFQMEQEGKGSLTDTSLENKKGGRTRIPAAGEWFSAACQSSGQFSMMARFAPRRLTQKGPARILTLSEGSQSRNFTLGQDGKDLVLRLRTTDTNLNGTTPEILLGELESDEPTTVVITYSEFHGLSGYRDGKILDLKPLTGSLENWSPMGLLIGNEEDEDRSWSGEVFAFELHSTVLDPGQAQELSQMP